MCVRKRVPAATTRKERVEGDGVGVGDGRRRDMARAKQPGGLGGAGHSSNGEHSPPTSAVGAIFSICGPKVCRCSPAT